MPLNNEYYYIRAPVPAPTPLNSTQSPFQFHSYFLFGFIVYNPQSNYYSPLYMGLVPSTGAKITYQELFPQMRVMFPPLETSNRQ